MTNKLTVWCVVVCICDLPCAIHQRFRRAECIRCEAILPDVGKEAESEEQEGEYVPYIFHRLPPFFLIILAWVGFMRVGIVVGSHPQCCLLGFLIPCRKYLYAQAEANNHINHIGY